MIKDVTVRLYFRTDEGELQDGEQDFGLESFAGFLPAVGDVILEPGVYDGLDRRKIENRRLLTVVQRIFNPRDLENYVALVVDVSTPTELQRDIC